jgi:hypothetical protein
MPGTSQQLSQPHRCAPNNGARPSVPVSHPPRRHTTGHEEGVRSTSNTCNCCSDSGNPCRNSRSNCTPARHLHRRQRRQAVQQGRELRGVVRAVVLPRERHCGADGARRARGSSWVVVGRRGHASHAKHHLKATRAACWHTVQGLHAVSVLPHSILQRIKPPPARHPTPRPAPPSPRPPASSSRATPSPACCIFPTKSGLSASSEQ